MNNEKTFPIKNPRQLKDKINNIANERNLVANTLLQNFMMERFLERVSISKYKDNIILKGGFLIAAMVGVDLRSTMDIDTTIRGISVNSDEIEKIIKEIIEIPLNDNIIFEMQSIKPIHEVGQYDDFRIGLVSSFFTIREHLKIDITTGDTITPKEINYSFPLMFEDRQINIKSYSIYNILAEKLETILSRNVLNTRARDYYDVYILLKDNSAAIDFSKLKLALFTKAKERNTLIYVEDYKKYLSDIENSQDLINIWESYKNKYPYAKDIDFSIIVSHIKKIFEQLYQCQ